MLLSEHRQMAKKLEGAEIIEKMIVQLSPTRETIYPCKSVQDAF